MFAIRRFKRWSIGGSFNLSWLLLYCLIFGVVIYSLVTGHTP